MSYCSQCAIRDKEVVAMKEQIRVLQLEAAARQKLEGPNVILVTSLVSHRTGKPRIDIQLGELHTQMSADSAVNVAEHIIEASEAAYSDAFVFNFMKERVGLDDQRGAQIISDFREYREKLRDEFDKEQEDFKA